MKTPLIALMCYTAYAQKYSPILTTNYSIPENTKLNALFSYWLNIGN